MKHSDARPAPRPLVKNILEPHADEVRASVRFPIHLPVRVEPEGSAPLHATTENISASGLLLTVERELPANSHIEFAIQMPADVLGTQSDVVVHGRGRVVRCYKVDAETRAAAVIDDYSLEAVDASHDASRRTH